MTKIIMKQMELPLKELESFIEVHLAWRTFKLLDRLKCEFEMKTTEK